MKNEATFMDVEAYIREMNTDTMYLDMAIDLFTKWMDQEVEYR